jgi:hypothetical protein
MHAKVKKTRAEFNSKNIDSELTCKKVITNSLTRSLLWPSLVMAFLLTQSPTTVYLMYGYK